VSGGVASAIVSDDVDVPLSAAGLLPEHAVMVINKAVTASDAIKCLFLMPDVFTFSAFRWDEHSKGPRNIS